MGYAPIKSIKLVNFRNFKDVVIEFGDKSMITLVGDNEAGKSSLSKSLETLGANLKPNIQKDYIRSGTSGFLVAVLLDDEDDTIIFRKKMPGFNGFGIQKKGQIVWSTDKMDENVVPPQVKEYMGFILEPETKELLNVRTYENLLLFITTKGSSNYKVMYNALKADNLSRAIKAGNKEANEYKSEIGASETNINAFTNQLRNIRTLDLSPLVVMRGRLESEQKSIAELESATELYKNIVSIQNELGELSRLDSIELVSEVEATALNNMYDYKEDLKSIEEKLGIYSQIKTCEEVGIDELNMLDTCKELLDELTSKNYEAYNVVSEIELVGEEEVQAWSRCSELMLDIKSIDTEFARYNTSLGGVTDLDLNIIEQIEKIVDIQKSVISIEKAMEETDREIIEVENQLKSFGVLVTTCRNCGETVIMES